MSERPARFNVLGVGVHAIDLDSASDLIARAIGARKPRYTAVTSVHGISIAQSDESFRSMLNRAYLCTPDGMPLVWMGHLQGHAGIERVYGPDLLLRLCDEGRARGWRHFFFGGRPGVAERLADRLTKRFPGLRVAGVFTPPFRDLTNEESADVAQRIREAQPDIMWVGLSTPKQERFMAKHVGQLQVPMMVGVGAAFDIHAGLVHQAPPWVQRAGLEWLFRLTVEPRRLWPRYRINNPAFIIRAILQLSGLKKYPLPPESPHD